MFFGEVAEWGLDGAGGSRLSHLANLIVIGQYHAHQNLMEKKRDYSIGTGIEITERLFKLGLFDNQPSWQQ